jgi:hypothetical protein
MLKRPILLALLCVSFSGSVMWAGPCVAGSLTSYISLGASGCNVGALRYFNFAYATSGVENSASILVTPNGSLTSPGFGMSGFLSDPGSSTTFSINYTVDPPPIIVRQFALLDPPMNDIFFDLNLCEDQLFGGGSLCADLSAPLNLHVDNTSPPTSLGGFLTLPTVASTIDVHETLTMGPGSSVDDVITHTDVSPEPATLGLTAVALLAVGAWKRREFNKGRSKWQAAERV